ncbi:MAG: helix-turn-helix transcriptional regulator [Bauldia sp.]|nr:helix-turn-helix transcriptional regulator [Bauldia sp.]
MAVRDELVETVGAVYAAGLDPSRWEDALARIGKTVGGIACTLELIDRQTMTHRQFREHGLPSVLELAYLSHYASVNPRWSLVLHQQAGELGWDYSIMGEDEMSRSDFYEDFLARVDFRYFAYGMLTATPGEFSGIAVHRARSQGHVERAEIRRLRVLVPHVQNAFDMSRRVSAARDTRAASLEQAFEWFADGVALVDTDGRLLYGNRAFFAIAERRDGILVQAERLAFALAVARRAFGVAMARVTSLRDGEPVGTAAGDFAVARPGGAPAYVISVRPILAPDTVGGDAVAMVVIHDPLGRVATEIDVLREAFGLTEAEAGLAHALQAGQSPSEYASTAGLSLNTVYTHLKRVKEKTATTRLSALVRKLKDVEGPLRAR